MSFWLKEKIERQISNLSNMLQECTVWSIEIYMQLRQILIDLFVSDVLLIDVQKVMRKISITIVFLIKSIQKLSEWYLILGTYGSHNVIIFTFGNFEAITNDPAPGDIGNFYRKWLDELLNVGISPIIDVNWVHFIRPSQTQSPSSMILRFSTHLFHLIWILSMNMIHAHLYKTIRSLTKDPFYVNDIIKTKPSIKYLIVKYQNI